MSECCQIWHLRTGVKKGIDCWIVECLDSENKHIYLILTSPTITYRLHYILFTDVQSSAIQGHRANEHGR